MSPVVINEIPDHHPEHAPPTLTTGTVVATNDPDGLGRVQLQLPWLLGGDTSNWARVVSPMAGADRGLWFPPEIGDEVLVGFFHDDVALPYVLGAVWSGKAHPPVLPAGDSHEYRVIRTAEGNEVQLVDADGEGWVEINSNGTRVVVAHDGKITISGDAVEISAGTTKLTMTETGTVLHCNRDVTIESAGTLTLRGAPLVHG